MKTVFADTYYWIALINTNEDSHQEVIQFSQNYPSVKLVTTDAIIDELLNFFCRKGTFLRTQAFTLTRRIYKDSSVQVIPHRDDIRQMAFNLYQQRSDKGYSFTDCVSMVVMKQMKIIEVLSQDKHFTQEGFTIIF